MQKDFYKASIIEEIKEKQKEKLTPQNLEYLSKTTKTKVKGN